MRRAITVCVVVVAVLLGVGPAAAQTGIDEFGRPLLEEEQMFETTHFLIHYTEVGDASVPAADEDASGTPDYVEAIAEALETAYAVQVEEWGWAAPPGDNGIGGDDRLDVYITQLFDVGIAGLVSPNDGWVGDNLNTVDVVERDAATSYMVIDNDFAELTDYEPAYDAADSLRYMRSVVAHEFNHMVQSGYNGFDDSIWLYEGTASWAEVNTIDNAEFALDYLAYTVKNPDYCLPNNDGREQSGLRWYGSWLFFAHLSETYGRDVMRDLWQGLGTQTGEEALRATLAAYDTTLEAETRAFAIKNLVRAYEDGESLPTVRLEGETGIGRFRPDDGVQALGADYVRIVVEERQPLAFELFEADTDMVLQLVRIVNGEAQVLTGVERIEAEVEADQPTFLMVFNAEAWTDPTGCTFADYGFTVQAIEAATPPDAEVFAAIDFVEPIVGDAAGPPSGILQVERPFVSDPDRRFGDRPEAIDVPFDIVVPEVTEGYTFDFATVREADDFGGLEPYYAPGGEDVAVFDYTNAAGEYLRVTQGESPYESLDDWIDEEDYEHSGAFETIGGVDVLIEDLSADEQGWFHLTMIVEGLFVVVDGSESEAAIREMAGGYLREAGAFIVEAETTASTPAVPRTLIPPQADIDPSVERDVMVAIGGTVAVGGFLIVLIVGTVLFILRRVIPN